LRACSPALPPTTVPVHPDGKAQAATGAEQSLRIRQTSLADALRTRLRPNAKQGDLVTPDMGAAIAREIQKANAPTPRINTTHE
jgi:hypothetical protein